MISKSRLDAITAATSPVACFKEVLSALVDDQTITADIAGIVGHALSHANEKGALDKAIAANVST